MNYQHHSIQINGRTVLIEEILNDRISSQSAFESSTYSFIEKWFSNATEFEFTTSGSTGAPKKISFTRDQLKASAQRTIEALSLQTNYNCLVCLDTKFIAGSMMLVRAFIGNMKLVVTEPSSDPLFDINEPIDFTALVPLQLQTILQHKESKQKLEKINAAIIGGAPLSNSQVELLQSLNCSFFATYGMTETMSHVALQKLNGHDRQLQFIALPGIKLSTDDRGCLVINTPELSEAVVTNDLVEFTREGFNIMGRWDSVINSGGIKIHPEKVEQALRNVLLGLNINHEACVIALPDNRLGEKAVAVIESASFDNSINDEILKRLSNVLTPYEIPKAIYCVPSLIYTPTGKINRLKTRQLISI